MVQQLQAQEGDLVIRFGGGVHSSTPEDEIGDREAADGRNFLLDFSNTELRNRPPFDLVATAANEGSVNGGGNLVKADGTIQAFFQAGNTVYEWDGQDLLSSALATVSSSAKLRGHWRSHQWTLGDKVLISDLALAEPLQEWDGSTWQDISFTSFGLLSAKYITVSNDRAKFFNVLQTSNPALPHLIVGSQIEDYAVITVSQKPASGNSAADPFYMVTPDLKPINGAVEAFGTTIISTERGELFNLAGVDATDFRFDTFYPGSAALGDEALAYIGNDILYGRQGRIESLRDTDRFGDSQADDITVKIADEIEAYTGWTTVYNQRLGRVYVFPTGVSECWVYHKALRDKDVSPWVKYDTMHAMAFQPTMAISMLDPADGLEYVFMGDSSGNIYRLEGTGTSGDGGSADVITEFLSKLFVLPLDLEQYDIEGWIKYRRKEAADISITLETSGVSLFEYPIVVPLPNASGGPYYSNDSYYSDGEYYGTARFNRLARQRITFPGGSNELQVRVRYDGTANIQINEVGLRFVASKA